MQSNWELIFADSWILQAFHFRKGGKELLHQVDYQIGKNVAIYLLSKCWILKEKEKDELQNAFFFRFHFFAFVCKAVSAGDFAHLSV